MQQDEQEQHKQESRPDREKDEILEGEVVSSITLEAEERAPEEEQQQAEDYLDQWRRTQADFINYRRRMGKELAEAGEAGQALLLRQLLPALDNFERALEAVPPDLKDHSWVQGLLLVARQFDALLDQLGIQKVGASGERFNPHFHEALTLDKRADIPEGTIVQVIQAGYMLRERVLRPAQVIVSSSPASVEGTPAS